MADNPSQLTSQAIQAALSANWDEAVRLNELILSVEPENVDALNRLARSCFELGDLTKSKKNYQRALELDPYNQIADKFIKRIEACSKKSLQPNGHKKDNGQAHIQYDSSSFIEEPGKTKLVNLIKVAEPQRLFFLSTGELVILVAKNRSVVVTNQDNQYLGVLPDDVSHRLLRLIKGGNKYQGYIKTIKSNGLSILIKETYRSARFKNQPSFLDAVVGTLAYSSDHIIVGDDDDEASEETEEDSSI